MKMRFSAQYRQRSTNGPQRYTVSCSPRAEAASITLSLKTLPANMAAAADGVTLHRSNGCEAADSLRMQISRAESFFVLMGMLLFPFPMNAS